MSEINLLLNDLTTLFDLQKTQNSLLNHCVKSVHIRSFSGPYSLAFGLNTEIYFVSLRIQSECIIVDHKSSEYGHFSRSELRY